MDNEKKIENETKHELSMEQMLSLTLENAEYILELLEFANDNIFYNLESNYKNDDFTLITDVLSFDKNQDYKNQNISISINKVKDFLSDIKSRVEDILKYYDEFEYLMQERYKTIMKHFDYIKKFESLPPDERKKIILDIDIIYERQEDEKRFDKLRQGL